jgi:hypothetical protein
MNRRFQKAWEVALIATLIGHVSQGLKLAFLVILFLQPQKEELGLIFDPALSPY